MNKKLLVVTGPQGSGNHLWSKIFAACPNIVGWKRLNTEYWLGHPHEPFSEIWRDPSIFLDLDWSNQFYVTGISCPFIQNSKNGTVIDDTKLYHIPKYDEFISYAKQAGFEVKVAIISRDKTILEKQQMRVRLKKTTNIFLETYRNILEKYSPFILSTESLYLYEDLYLKHLSDYLEFPIEVDNEKLQDILKDDSNAKYIQFVNDHWLDKHILEVAKKNGMGSRLKNPDIYHRENDDKWQV